MKNITEEERLKHERLIKLGRALLELTKQNIIATIVMSLIFPFTARRLSKIVEQTRECCECGDLGTDKDYDL